MFIPLRRASYSPRRARAFSSLLPDIDLEAHKIANPKCNITLQVWRLVKRDLLSIRNHPLSILKAKI